MKSHVYEKSDQHPVALLIKESAWNLAEIEGNYTIPLESKKVRRGDLVIAGLEYNEKGKAPVKYCKEYLAKLLPELAALGTKYLYCADAAYFKVLTGATKAEPNLGYVLPCKLDGYEHMEVTLGVNHKSLMYNPNNEPKLLLSVDTMAQFVNGTHLGLGHDIIHSAHYPKDLEAIQQTLDALMTYPELSADIEAFSLKHNKAGIGTIGFAWDEHNGVAFACDYQALPGGRNEAGEYGRYVLNRDVRIALRTFLEAYQGKLTWHNANYDVKVLIYCLWMTHAHDTNGLLKGLDIMCRAFDDTKIIAYLATNSTAGNELGLKQLAHEFAGNYAQEDIKDIRRIPLPELLEYNLVDCLSTNYVKEKHWNTMVLDGQLDIYREMMLPSVKTLLQVELTGMPLSPKRVAEVRLELEVITAEQNTIIFGSPVVRKLTKLLQREEMIKANAKLKVKQHPLSHFADYTFNPNSDNQKRKLLYEVMGLPIIDLTKGKQAATGGDTLEKLVNHTQDPEYKAVIEALIMHAGAEKILSTFIPAFEQAIEKGDEGIAWLHGSFNLGGTVSGRLSSSKPNLQNLPSGSTYGKLIKSCFMAPKGWLFVGADFASLEDRINALLTKDPNKLKVYTDGYDGHSLRTYYYWKNQFPDITEAPESINSLKDHPLRDKSKGPTFALTYQGTWKTLVNNAGFSPQEAKDIEANYHALYAVSTQWVKDRIEQACEDGYATAAFGLRIRTPLLARTYLGHKTTPREAEAEGRTLGNAISGQSYGLLNNRAMNDVMEKVWKSKYRFYILPCAAIHDAGYFVIKDDLEVIEWLNRELIKSMEWQDLPEIRHDEVKLGAELDIFFPSWAEAMTLPNGVSAAEIRTLAKGYQAELLEKRKLAA